MKTKPLFFLSWALLLFCLENLHGQTESASKYYQALRQTPTRDYLFDRFFDSFLETNSVEQLEQFLRKEPNETTKYILLGQFFERQGNNDKALNIYNQIIESKEPPTEIRLSRARLLARKLDFTNAIADLEAALKQNTIKSEQQIQITKLKGNYLLRLDEHEQALDIWNQLLKQFPDDHDLHEDLIELLAREGQFDQAIEKSNALIAKTKNPYEKTIRQLRKAELYLYADQPDNALTTYNATLSVTGIGTWLEREIITNVETYFRRGDDIDSLLDWLKEKSTTNPQRTSIGKSYARVLVEQGDTKTGLNVFRNLLEKNPGDYSLKEEFVALLTATGNYKEAIKQQTVLIEQNPEDAEAELVIANLHHLNEQPTETVEAIDRFLDKSDQYEVDYLRAARFLRKYNANEAAENTFKKGVESHPDSQKLAESYASFLYEAAKINESLELYQTIAKTAQPRQLIRLANALVDFNENQEAYDLLHSRYEDFKNDFDFLGAYIILTSKTKRDPTNSILRRLQRSKDADQLNVCLNETARVMSNREQRDQLIKTLAKKEQRNTYETSLLARLYERDQQIDRAVTLIENVLESASQDDQLIFLNQLAYLHRREREFDLEAEVIKQLIKLPGQRTSRTIQALVRAYQQSAQEESALDWVAEWKKLSPGSSSPWLREADLLRTIDELDQGIANLRRATTKFRDDINLQTKMGELYRYNGNEKESMRIFWSLYEKAENAGSKSLRVKNLYQTASEFDSVNELLEKFSERQRKNRTSIDPIMAMAEIHQLAKDWPSRRNSLNQAARLKPNDLSLLNAIADAELAMGDWNAAKTTLSSARLKDKSGKTLQKLARLEIQFGKPEDGFQLLTDALLQSQGGIDSLMLEEIVDMMIANNYAESVEAYLEKYIDQFSDNYRLKYLFAIALQESGEFEKSAKQFLTLIKEEKEMEKPFIDLLPHYSQLKNWKKFTRGPDLKVLDFWFKIETFYTFNYRDNNHSANYLKSQGVDRHVLPPITLDFLHTMSLLHLGNLFDDLEESTRIQLVAELEKSNIPYPKLSLEIAKLKGANSGFKFDIPIDLVKSNSNNLDLLKFWISTRIYGPQAKGSNEIARVAVDNFTNSGETFWASLTTLYLSTLEEISDPVFAENLKIVSTAHSEHINRIIAWPIITRCLGYSYLQRTTTVTTTAQKLQIIDCLLKTPEFLNPRNTLNQTYSQFSMLMAGCQVLHQNKKYTESIQWLQLFSEIPIQKDSKTQFVAPSKSSRSQSFYLESINPALFMFSNFSGSINWQDAAFIKTITNFDNQPLKTLLAFIAEQEELLTNEVEKIEGLDNKTVDQYLILGFVAKRKTDWKTAIESFSAAREISRSKITNRVIDSEIVIALYDEVAKNDPELLRIGREAALQIKKDWAINGLPQQANQIATILQQVGLHSEARNVLASAKQTSSISQIRKTVGNSGQSIRSRIETLLAAGKQDAANKLGLRTVRDIAREAAKPNNRNWRSGYYDIYNLYRNKQLPKSEVSGLVDAAGTNVKRLYEAACAQHLFVDQHSALPVYEKVVEYDPNHIQARSRAVVIYAQQKKINEATQLIKQVDPDQLSELLTAVSNQNQSFAYYRPGEGFEVYINEVLVEVLENSDLSDLGEWGGTIQSYFTRMEATHDWGSVEIGHVHELNPIFEDRVNSNASKQQSEALEKRREEIRQKYFEVINSRAPELKPLAFASQVASAIRSGQDEDDFLEQAKAIVDSQGQLKNHFKYQFNFSAEQNIAPIYNPREFLVRYYAKRNDRENALKWCNSDRKSDQVASQRFAELYLCQPDDFPKAAESFLNTSNQTFKFFHTIWAWQDRQLAPELIKPIVALAIEKNQYSNWGGTLLFALSEHSRFSTPTDAYHEYFGWIAEAMLGKTPEERKKEAATAFDSNGNFNYNSMGGRFYYRHIAPVSKHERFFFAAADNLKPLGLSTQLLLDYNYQYRDPDYFRKQANIKTVFKLAPWFGELKDIAIIDSSDYQYRSGSMYSYLINRAKKDTTIRKHIKEALTDCPDSFSKSLFSIVTEPENNQDERLLKLLLDHLDEFKALPEAELNSWANIFSINQLSIKKVDASDPNYAAYSHFNAMGMRSRKDALEKFLKAGTVRDTGYSDYEFSSELSALIGQWIPLDRQKAKDIFLHGSKLVRKSQANSNWRGNSSRNGWVWGPKFLNDYLNKKQNGLADIGFWIDLMREDQKGRYPATGWTNSGSIPHRIREEISKQGGSGIAEQSVPLALKNMHKEIGDGPISILAPSFYHVYLSSPKQDRLKLFQQADKVAESSAPEATLAKEMAMAGRFYFAAETGIKNGPTKQQRDEIKDLNLWQDHALANLQESGLSGSWMIPLAHHYAHRGRRDINADIAMEIGKALRDGLVAQADLNGYAIPHIVRAFLTIQDQPGWQEIAATINDRWWHKNRNNNKNNYTDLAFDPVSPAVLAMLELHLAVGDYDSYQKFTRLTADNFVDQPGSLFLLVENGAFPQAKEMLIKQFEKLDGSAYSTSDRHHIVRYTEKGHLQIAKFLEYLDDPNHRLFAEVILKSAPDLKSEDQKKLKDWISRGNRIDQLAIKIRDAKENPFTNDQWRDRTYQQLIVGTGSGAAFLRKQLAESAKDIDVQSVPQLNDANQVLTAMRIPANHAWMQASKNGSTTELEQYWNDITSSMPSSNYYHRKALEGLTEPIRQHLLPKCFIMKQEERLNAIEAGKVIFSQYEQANTHFDNHDDLSCAIVLTAIAAGQEEELIDWLQNAKIANRKDVLEANATHYQTVYECLKQAFRPQAGNSEFDKRAEICRAYFENPMIRLAFSNIDERKKVFQKLIDHKIFTRDEIFKAGKTLEEDWPRASHAARELMLMAIADQNYKEALKWAEVGLTRLPVLQNKPPAMRGNFLLQRVFLLQKTGQSEAATKAYQEFEAVSQHYQSSQQKKLNKQVRKEFGFE